MPEKINLKEWILRNLIVIFIITGILSLFLGHYFEALYITDKAETTKSLWQNFAPAFFKNLASITLAAGIFSAITKSALFLGIFEKVVEKVIWSEEYLKNRSDLRQIWEKTSKHLYQEKFPDINRDIEKIIFDKYFPTGHYFYYHDFKMNIILKLDKNGYLVYDETISFIAKAVSEHTPIPYIWKSHIPKKSSDLHTHFEIPTVKIDDEPVDVANCFSLEVTDTKLEAQLSLNLKGKKKYDFLIQMRKVVPYEANRTKSVSTKYFIHNLDVTFTYPKLLKLEFIECGTIGNFKTIGEHDIDLNSKQIIKRYDGLIFPRQGFVFFLTK